MKEERITNKNETGALKTDELEGVTGGTAVRPPYSPRKPLQKKEPLANADVAEANKQEKF